MIALTGIVALVVGLVLAPLLRSVVNRTKAKVAGRVGPPWLQPYRDIVKLLRKGAVYSRTTTWLFRAGPIVSLAAALVAFAIIPLGGSSAPIAFTGDLLLVAYLLALGRLFTILAALDTGSAFEGMGADREMLFGALAEPVMLLVFASLAREVGSLSLSGIYAGAPASLWAQAPSVAVLAALALFLVLLCENSRIPVDDPTTHLELTMIHEVMVLDHGGVDLAFVEYAQAIKLWLFAALVAGVLIPIQGLSAWGGLAALTAAILGVGVVVGLVESTMARLRMPMVPHLLFGGVVLSALSVLLEVV